MVKFRVLSESFRALLGRAYTVKYPFQPSPPPETYRGKLEYNPDRCTGCGACVEACPAGAVTLTDVDGRRIVEVWYGKCTQCARCQEVCPDNAITFKPTHDLTTYSKEEIKHKVELPLTKCIICGKPITTDKQSAKINEKIEPFLPAIEYFSRLCLECRKREHVTMVFRKKIVEDGFPNANR